MDVTEYEPRAGVFRKEALHHLAEAHAIPGGVIPSAVPYLGWTIGIVTFAVAIFLVTLSMIKLPEQVTSRVVVTAPKDGQWVGKRFSAGLAGAERDRLWPGQLAAVEFDRPGVHAGAVVESISSASHIENAELRFEAWLRFTTNPNAVVADRDQQVIVRVTTGERSVLAVLVGPKE